MCALVTGVHTCALPIFADEADQRVELADVFLHLRRLRHLVPEATAHPVAGGEPGLAMQLVLAHVIVERRPRLRWQAEVEQQTFLVDLLDRKSTRLNSSH